jgi:hypothetical protein
MQRPPTTGSGDRVTYLKAFAGEAIGGIFIELRVRRPNGRVRPLLIRTTAVDPVGNESSLDARVKLPK